LIIEYFGPTWFIYEVLYMTFKKLSNIYFDTEVIIVNKWGIVQLETILGYVDRRGNSYDF